MLVRPLVRSVVSPLVRSVTERTRGQRAPEKLKNGDFSEGATNWTVSGTDATHIITFAGGTMRYQSNTTTPVLVLSQSGVPILTSGKTYEIVTEVSNYVSGSLQSDRFSGALVTAGGTNKRTLVCSSTGTTFNLYRVTGVADITIDSISIREVF
jgi:hypothetical protein